MKSLILLMSLVSFNLYAFDIEAGKKRYEQVCKTCHDLSKEETRAAFPKLAGQNPAYLSSQLFLYQKGLRKSSTMEHISRTLTREDVYNVSQYIYSLGSSCK
jgi:cytochrome c553